MTAKTRNMIISTYLQLDSNKEISPRNKLLLTNWTSLSWKDLKKTKHSIDKIYNVLKAHSDYRKTAEYVLHTRLHLWTSHRKQSTESAK